MKRSKKVVRRIDGSQAGMSQNLSEIRPIFTCRIFVVEGKSMQAEEPLYPYLGTESRARGKIFHVAFEVASISLQCGTHLKQQNEM